MKLITRYTDYSIRALIFIARKKGEIITASDLVENLKIPRPFLRRLLQILNKEKILKSYKGKGGGFRLLRAPDKIYIVDLIKIFQGPLRLNECIFKKNICPNIKVCRFKNRLDKIEKNVILELKPITISSLLN